jgi:hypothetical protein
VRGVRILLRIPAAGGHGRRPQRRPDGLGLSAHVRRHRRRRLVFSLEAAPDKIAPERGRPPLNAARHCSPEAPPVIERPDDLELRWVYEEERLVSVEIVVDDRALARLAPGAKPGWSRFAAVDGPCARAMR